MQARRHPEGCKPPHASP